MKRGRLAIVLGDVARARVAPEERGRDGFEERAARRGRGDEQGGARTGRGAEGPPAGAEGGDGDQREQLARERRREGRVLAAR